MYAAVLGKTVFVAFFDLKLVPIRQFIIFQKFPISPSKKLCFQIERMYFL